MMKWRQITITSLTAFAVLSSVSCMPSSYNAVQSSRLVDSSAGKNAASAKTWRGLPDDEDAAITGDDVRPDVINPEPIELEDDVAKTIRAAEAEAASEESKSKPATKKDVESEEKKEQPKAEQPKAEQPKATDTKSEKPVEKVDIDKTADFTGPGVLKPTVYFFASFNEDESKCTQDTVLHGKGGVELIRVCKKTEEDCGLQGSCAVIQNGKARSFNVIGRFEGQDRYFEIDEDGCRFGYGVRESCLDPFYTLAADLGIYKPGQVIYVPAVVGLILPDGSKHTGYFVIRDQGRGIKGTGRFDFFSGTFSWRNSKNPFKKLGLGDVNTNIPYFKVSGKTAEKILKRRAFPQLPVH